MQQNYGQTYIGNQQDFKTDVKFRYDLGMPGGSNG